MNKLTPNLSSNSVLVNFDQDPQYHSNPNSIIWDIPVNSNINRYELATLTWRGTNSNSADNPSENPKVFSLTAGAHTLYIRGREPDVRLDYILVQPYSGVQGASTDTPIHTSLLDRAADAVRGIIFGGSSE